MQVIHSLRAVLDLVQQADSQSLLLLDIDETLLHAGEGFGSEPWYDQEIQRRIASGAVPEAAILEVNAMWEAEQHQIEVHLADPLIPEILQSCVTREVPTMGLTARRPETAAFTKEQLGKLGVDLQKTAWLAADREVSPVARHLNGILFGGPLVQKGLLFGELLRQLGKKPRHVIYADDKETHAKTVAALCAREGILANCFQFLRPR